MMHLNVFVSVLDKVILHKFKLGKRHWFLSPAQTFSFNLKQCVYVFSYASPGLRAETLRHISINRDLSDCCQSQEFDVLFASCARVTSEWAQQHHKPLVWNFR